MISKFNKLLLCNCAHFYVQNSDRKMRSKYNKLLWENSDQIEVGFCSIHFYKSMTGNSITSTSMKLDR
jgi:hypothetical protein